MPCFFLLFFLAGVRERSRLDVFAQGGGQMISRKALGGRRLWKGEWWWWWWWWWWWMGKCGAARGGEEEAEGIFGYLMILGSYN